MKKVIGFSRGERDKYAGRRIRIIGGSKVTQQESGKYCYLVALPSGIEFFVFAENEVAARQSAIAYFTRGRLPKGIYLTIRLFDDYEV